MAENGPLCGPVFDFENPPEKVYVGSLFCILSQEMRHMNFFFRGSKMGGFGWRPRSLVYVLFPSPTLESTACGSKSSVDVVYDWWSPTLVAAAKTLNTVVSKLITDTDFSRETYFPMGEAFLLTVGAFLLTVKLLCLQSLKALMRRTFPL